MSTYIRSGIQRRQLLKYAGAAAGAALVGVRPTRAWADLDDGKNFVQTVNHARLYMTHYATFHEPDPSIPPALYFDLTSGIPTPTQAYSLATPFDTATFTRQRHDHGLSVAPADTSLFLPYGVSPPGFPALPAPPGVVAFLQGLTGLPAAIIQSSTAVQIVAIGQFVGSGPSTARVRGDHLEIDKTVTFQVRISIGFLFTPPAGLPAPQVGCITAILTLGILHQLIPQLGPTPTPNEVIVYSWSAPMTLSTRNSYVRTIASQPPPVADPFDPSLTEIAFVGSPIDRHGNYTIVGSASPSQVAFVAPPELQFFLFGTTALTDVEFAVEQGGVLIPTEPSDD
jgi:hypothetical protein